MASADPGNVGYGQLVGRFTSFVLDGPDPGEEPDWEPIPDLTISITPSPLWLLNLTAAGGPVTIVPRPFPCTTDRDGYLAIVLPDRSLQRGVTLVATDDPDNNPSGWTYSVRVRGAGIDRRFSIAVPEGSVQDLAVLMPVASSPGNAITKGPKGDSAYEVAVANGFTGTPAEWLASITTFGVLPVDGHPGIAEMTGIGVLPQVAPGIYELDFGG